MNNELAEKLNPTKYSDLERQQVLEKLVFNQETPDPELWRTIIPALEKEPVKWIQQLEARLLKRLPFHVDFMTASLSLLNASSSPVRSEGAGLIQQVVDRLIAEKNKEALCTFEKNFLTPLVSQLKREEIIGQQHVWIALYKTLAYLSGSPEVSQTMVELLPKGGDEALYIFSQYVQGEHPTVCLDPLLKGLKGTKSDDTAIHLLRGLMVSFPKKGEPAGYASTEELIQAVLTGLHSNSENIRREAAGVLASRAKLANREKTQIPLENDVWDALFTLYEKRLPMPTARDKDSANLALAVLPINQERLARLFEVMHRVEDEMEKQSVVGLIGGFKSSDARTELLRLLRENFAGLRLAAQKVTIDAVTKYLPDEEIELELDRLLEGKGLHSDILSKLGDKLFAPLPSLKERLMKWLGLHVKTRRPLLEQFPLPMMHTKVILAAKKLAGDRDIQDRLKVLEPLLMMNDAKVRLHEILQRLPSEPKPEVLSINQMASALIAKIVPLSQARIVFKGFSLPEAFGESKELEFGNAEQAKAQGLGSGAVEMGKDFVKTAIEDIFSEESEIEENKFCLMDEGGGTFTITALREAS